MTELQDRGDEAEITRLKRRIDELEARVCLWAEEAMQQRDLTDEYCRDEWQRGFEAGKVADLAAIDALIHGVVK